MLSEAKEYKGLILKMAMCVLTGSALLSLYNDRLILVGAFIGFVVFIMTNAKEI